jgi:hypothetical protein
VALEKNNHKEVREDLGTPRTMAAESPVRTEVTDKSKNCEGQQ